MGNCFLEGSKENFQEKSVAVRQYSSSEKWEFVKILSRTGKLLYREILDVVRVWLRHVNQMRRIGKRVLNVPNQNVCDYYVAYDEMIDVRPASIANDFTPQNILPRSRGQGRALVRENDQIQRPGLNVDVNATPRRSGREVRIPGHLRGFDSRGFRDSSV
ncbi:hypothetical protein QAD02_007409 [Eretmocerus hayati]|uniref:Uncharacterized protein n=1 Tax=Eretmocerus hayati TaxID=131215 RepID=A0ACC2N3K7_9HYME|nr:hypothetical protein QAD02_007409 [Eretmocerus hayati]